MSEPIPTPRTSTLFKSLPLESPVDWMNGMNKMAKHGYALETECTRLRTAMKSCLSAWIRTGLSSADFDLYKESKALLAKLDSQQKQP